MNLRAGSPPSLIPKPTPIKSAEILKNLVDQKDYDFINGLHVTQVIDLLHASNYLNMPGLRQLTAAMLSVRISVDSRGGVEITQLKNRFGFQDNFTESEIRRINNIYFEGERKKEIIRRSTILKKDYKSPFSFIRDDLVIYDILPFLMVRITKNQTEKITYLLFGTLPTSFLYEEGVQKRRRGIFFLGQNLNIEGELTIVKVPFQRVKNLSLTQYTSPMGNPLRNIPLKTIRELPNQLISLESEGSSILLPDMFKKPYSLYFEVVPGNFKPIRIKSLRIYRIHQGFFDVNNWKEFSDLEHLVIHRVQGFEDVFFQEHNIPP